MSQCTETNYSERVAIILENIPLSFEDAISAYKLCPASNKSTSSCKQCTLSTITFLQVFDAITISNDAKEEAIKVKAKSEIATYFLRSLAAYVRRGFKIVSNWGGEGVGQNNSLDQALSSGSRLVYIMEKMRTEPPHNDLTPTRQVSVSEAIIKAKIRGRREPVYLVEFDDKSLHFQLIGGRKRESDIENLTTMKREISEELAGNNLVYERDYSLRELASGISTKNLSDTFGAYTEYHFSFYQIFLKRSQLQLSPHDRWVTLSELLTGKTRDGKSIKVPPELDQKLPGGLKGLPLSLSEIQKRSFLEIFKEKPLEWIGFILTILGTILSIIFFFLQR